MSDKNKKNKKKRRNIDIVAIIIRVIAIIVIIAFFGWLVWAYFFIYKPEEKRFVRNSRIAYKKISEVIYDIYKQKSKVYETADEDNDSVCITLAEKLSKDKRGRCRKNPSGMPELNFVIKNTKIAILGLEREGIKEDKNIIKEFIIDVDGIDRGPNEIGIDRVPLQIHSEGRMGGKLMPVNCKLEDSKDFLIPRSKFCPTGLDVDYLTTNIPFGYDVHQIGSNRGKIETITKNVSFARADCAAFGGDILGGDYCEGKGIYWLKRCYEEYYCGFEPTNR